VKAINSNLMVHRSSHSSNSNINSNNSSRTSNSQRIHIHTTRAHTAESDPTTHLRERLEFDTTKTPCLVFLLVRVWRQPAFLATILDVAQVLRLETVMGSHQVGHRVADLCLDITQNSDGDSSAIENSKARIGVPAFLAFDTTDGRVLRSQSSTRLLTQPLRTSLYNCLAITKKRRRIACITRRKRKNEPQKQKNTYTVHVEGTRTRMTHTSTSFTPIHTYRDGRTPIPYDFLPFLQFLCALCDAFITLLSLIIHFETAEPKTLY
jgi:hypothetical protein